MCLMLSMNDRDETAQEMRPESAEDLEEGELTDDDDDNDNDNDNDKEEEEMNDTAENKDNDSVNASSREAQDDEDDEDDHERRARNLRRQIKALEQRMNDGLDDDDDDYDHDHLTRRKRKKRRKSRLSSSSRSPSGERDDFFHPPTTKDRGAELKRRRMDRANRSRVKSDRICELYMLGKCPKSPDRCMYSHEGKPPRIMELCKFYLFDRCAKREKCLYLHKDFPCKYFHTGKRCLETPESCKFSHGPLDDQTRAILLKAINHLARHQQQLTLTLLMLLLQHLESAPKEILGDFPRMSREAAIQCVYATEAKNKGWKNTQSSKESTRKDDNPLANQSKSESFSKDDQCKEVAQVEQSSEEMTKARNSRWQSPSADVESLSTSEESRSMSSTRSEAGPQSTSSSIEGANLRAPLTASNATLKQQTRALLPTPNFAPRALGGAPMGNTSMQQPVSGKVAEAATSPKDDRDGQQRTAEVDEDDNKGDQTPNDPWYSSDEDTENKKDEEHREENKLSDRPTENPLDGNTGNTRVVEQEKRSREESQVEDEHVYRSNAMEELAPMRTNELNRLRNMDERNRFGYKRMDEMSRFAGNRMDAHRFGRNRMDAPIRFNPHRMEGNVRFANRSMDGRNRFGIRTEGINRFAGVRMNEGNRFGSMHRFPPYRMPDGMIRAGNRFGNAFGEANRPSDNRLPEGNRFGNTYDEGSRFGNNDYDEGNRVPERNRFGSNYGEGNRFGNNNYDEGNRFGNNNYDEGNRFGNHDYDEGNRRPEGDRFGHNVMEEATSYRRDEGNRLGNNPLDDHIRFESNMREEEFEHNPKGIRESTLDATGNAPRTDDMEGNRNMGNTLRDNSNRFVNNDVEEAERHNEVMDSLSTSKDFDKVANPLSSTTNETNVRPPRRDPRLALSGSQTGSKTENELLSTDTKAGKVVSERRDPRLKVKMEREKEERMMSVDLGEVFGDLVIPNFATNVVDNDEREDSSLPFKRHQITPSVEIDASLSTQNNPVQYRLHVLPVHKPNYKAVLATTHLSKTAIQADPRLNRCDDDNNNDGAKNKNEGNTSSSSSMRRDPRRRGDR